MLLSLLALAPLVAGHTLMTTLYVDGENQGDGVCIRQNDNPEKATFPISPLANDAMACGYNGETANKRTCPISQNSTLTFKFREWPDGSQGGSIDDGHKGPCAVYMKPVEDATASNNAASGDGWFKVYENTYDEDESQWCTEKLIANNGFLSVNVPQGLKGGDYLVRTELLALHAAQDDPPDPQFYVGCAQVFLEGSENGAVPEGIAIDKDTYDLGIKGLTYNLYSTPLELPYPRFGPAVYKPDAKAAKAASGEQAVQKKGLEPEGCILVRDDWCGFEVPSYSDEEGCWASSKNCWNQTDVCYETAPPTGSKNCKIWENKCNNIDDQCNAGNFNGPPNKGKDLTPKLEGIDGSTAEYSGSISSSQFEGPNDSSKDSGSDSTTTATTTTAATTTATATATEAETADADAGAGRGSGKGHCRAKYSH